MLCEMLRSIRINSSDPDKNENNERVAYEEGDNIFCPSENQHDAHQEKLEAKAQAGNSSHKPLGEPFSLGSFPIHEENSFVKLPIAKIIQAKENIHGAL